MKDLRGKIRDVQRAVGVDADGIFGPMTAGAVYAALNRREPGGEDPATELEPIGELDERTMRTFATLDERAREKFERFARLAKATAAAMGCDYVAISGNRTWDEQNGLYAKGRTAPGPRVTKARGGYSWHNFGLAVDFGVFRGTHYLDSSNPTLARRVHVACSAHAEECGLEWGGDWRRFQDIPHFHIAGFPSTPTAAHRKEFRERGSVL